jgi:hypothetical protein
VRTTRIRRAISARALCGCRKDYSRNSGLATFCGQIEVYFHIVVTLWRPWLDSLKDAHRGNVLKRFAIAYEPVLLPWLSLLG